MRRKARCSNLSSPLLQPEIEYRYFARWILGGPTAPDVEWQCEAQPNHASGDAQSQSVECDGQAHTLVWAKLCPWVRL
jgi:hypothetical protein